MSYTAQIVFDGNLLSRLFGQRKVFSPLIKLEHVKHNITRICFIVCSSFCREQENFQLAFIVIHIYIIHTCIRVGRRTDNQKNIQVGKQTNVYMYSYIVFLSSAKKDYTYMHERLGFFAHKKLCRHYEILIKGPKIEQVLRKQ